MRALNNPSWVFDWSVKDAYFHRYSSGVQRGLDGHWGYPMYVYQGPIAAAMAAATFTCSGAGTE